MRLGLAGGFQKIAENRKLGFDYIEVGVGNITKLSESEFAECTTTAAGNNLSCAACPQLLHKHNCGRTAKRSLHQRYFHTIVYQAVYR